MILALKKVNPFLILYNLVGVTIVYLGPMVTHLTKFPFYYLEPMRVILIVSLCHFPMINSIILALSLPGLSFLMVGHPGLLKAILMTFELLINIGVFNILSKNIHSKFLVICISICFSKIFYYTLKWLFIGKGLIYGALISTPLYWQVVICFILGLYGVLFWTKKRI